MGGFKADKDLERQVLACCLLSGKSFGLPKEAMRIKKHQIVLGAIGYLEKQKKTITLASVYAICSEYQKGIEPAFLADMVERWLPFIPGSVPAEIQQHYHEQALKYYRSWLMIDAITNQVLNNFDDVDSAIIAIEKKLDEIKKIRMATSDTSIKKSVVSFCKSMDKEESFLKSGIAQLDHILGGGYEPGAYIVVAARPSVGKTAFALSSILHSYQYHRHLLLSFEMSTTQLIRRMVSMITGISYHSIKKIYAGGSDQAEKIISAADRIYQSKLRIIDNNKITLPEIERIVDAYRPDVVWVDYLQLMSRALPGAKFQNREREIAEYSAFFKGLAKEFTCPVIVLAQFNRKSTEGGRPYLYHLRESGAIEQDIDVGIILHAQSLEDDNRKIFIDKNRNGPVTSFDVQYNRQRMRFYEIEEKEE